MPIKTSDMDFLMRAFNVPYGDQLFIYNMSKMPFSELLSDSLMKSGPSLLVVVFRSMIGFLDNPGGLCGIDLGCDIGHFSFLMAEGGVDMTGVELNNVRCDIFNAISRIRGIDNTARCINAPMQEFLGDFDKKFSFAIFLNSFDNMVEKSSAVVGDKVLMDVSRVTPIMFFMSGPTPRFNDQEAIPKYITSVSRYTNYDRLLNRIYPNRDLFAFYYDADDTGCSPSPGQ